MAFSLLYISEFLRILDKHAYLCEGTKIFNERLNLLFLLIMIRGFCNTQRKFVFFLFGKFLLKETLLKKSDVKNYKINIFFIFLNLISLISKDGD